MKLLLSVYFFFFATFQLGLLIGISHYIGPKSQSKPNPYWLTALVINIVGLILFAIGILLTADIQKPPGIFTFANVLFYAAAIFQGAFFYSLSKSITRRLWWGLSISIVLFGIIFEYLRLFVSFEARTVFAVSVYAVVFIWQIREAFLINQKLKLQQLRYFQYAAIGEAFFLLPRLIVLLGTDNPIRSMDELPLLLILFTLGQILMNTISFIAIWGYWSERLALENSKTETENETFKKVLAERETLIASLLRANKTSSTGALSASIAHEINQPLGAIQINSEFLQRKLQDENLDRELITRIAKDIVKDNIRAARIIHTLKAIFTEKYAAISDSNSVIEVINSVLLLSRSDLNQKGIQVELEIENNLQIPMSYGEAQQLFINLFNNSIQALDGLQMPTKIIRIVGRQKGDITEIWVEDNGQGVALDQQSGLFDLFTSTKREGMGLGLWLCNYIVTRHGGCIQYASQQDTGAAFKLTFTASN
jgi:signal transduction histidine kinase